MPIHIGIPKSYGLRVYRSTPRDAAGDQRYASPELEVELAQDHNGWYEAESRPPGWSEQLLTQAAQTPKTPHRTPSTRVDADDSFRARRRCADLQRLSPDISPDEFISPPTGGRVAQLKQEAFAHRRTASRELHTPQTPQTPRTPYTASEMSTPVTPASEACEQLVKKLTAAGIGEWPHKQAAHSRQVSSAGSSGGHHRTSSSLSWRSFSAGLRSPMRAAQGTGIYASSPKQSESTPVSRTPISSPSYAHAISSTPKNKITVVRASPRTPPRSPSYRSRLSALNSEREQTPGSICSSHDSLYEDYETSTPQAPRFGLSLKPAAETSTVPGAAETGTRCPFDFGSGSGDDSTLDDDSLHSSDYNDLEVQLLEGVCEKVQSQKVRSLKAHIVYYVDGREVSL